MIIRTVRIVLSRMWTFVVCTFSLAVLALTGSCRSKKVVKAPDVEEVKPADEVVDEYIGGRKDNTLSPMLAQPGDSKTVKDMIQESNALKESLSRRMNSVVYGPPEVMKRLADEDAQLRHKIDSIDSEIKKARKK